MAKRLSANQIGKRYAADQIESDGFHHYMWEILKTAKKHPDAHLPLPKTKKEAIASAKLFLHDFWMDARRDIATHSLASIGVDPDDASDFWKGLKGFLAQKNTINDVAIRILSIVKTLAITRMS